jgi:hypothetical protein
MTLKSGLESVELGRNAEEMRRGGGEIIAEKLI